MSMPRERSRRPVPLKVAVLPNTNAKLIGRFGVGAVLFFALKGLLWLAVPATVAALSRPASPSASAAPSPR